MTQPENDFMARVEDARALLQAGLQRTDRVSRDKPEFVQERAAFTLADDTLGTGGVFADLREFTRHLVASRRIPKAHVMEVERDELRLATTVRYTWYAVGLVEEKTNVL